MASLAPLNTKVDPLQSTLLPPPSSLSSTSSPSPSSFPGSDVTAAQKNNSHDIGNDNDNGNSSSTTVNNDTVASPSRPSIYPIPQKGHRIIDGSEFGSEEYEQEKSDPMMSSSISSRNRVILGPGGTLAVSGGGKVNALTPQTSSNYPESRKALLESSTYSMSSARSSTGSLSDPESKTSLINPMETPLNPGSVPHPKLSKVGPYLTISALQAYTVMTVVRCLADPTWIVLKTSQDKTGGGQEDPLTLKLGLIDKRERIWLSLAIGFSILNCIGVTMRIMDRMTRLRKVVVVSAFLQAGFCIAAVTSFLRTHELPPGAQYSHGFLSCVMTMIFSSVVALMLSWDWWRGFPSAGLSATLKELIVSSFVTTAVILVGATIYTRLEGWTFDQSVNFCIVSFATIGYGNISPKSVAGRIIFFFYGLLGISAIGFFIVSLRNAIIEQFQWRLVDRFSLPAHMTRVQTRMSVKDLSFPMARFEEEQRVKRLIKRKMIVRMLAMWIMLWFGGAGVFCAFEKWSYLESLYFCFVTLTTIGFGDYVPQEPGSIEFWNIYVFIGLTVFAYILSLFSESMASHIHLVDDVDMDDEDGDGIYGWEQCEDPNAPLAARNATLGMEGLKWAQNQQMPYRGSPNQKETSLPSVLHQPGQQTNSDRATLKQGVVHFWHENQAPQQPPTSSTATDTPGHPLADANGDMFFSNTTPRQESMPQQLLFRPKRKNSSGRVLMISSKERKQMLQAEYYATHGGPPMPHGTSGNVDSNENHGGVSDSHGTSSGQGGMMVGATIKFVDIYGIPHQRVVGRRMSLLPNGATGSGAGPGAGTGPHNVPYGHDGGGPLPQGYMFGTTGYFDDLARRRRGTVAAIHVPGMAAAAEEAAREHQLHQQHQHHHYYHHHRDQHTEKHAGNEKTEGSDLKGTQQHLEGGTSGRVMVGTYQQLLERQSTPPPSQTNVLQHQPQVKFESPRSGSRTNVFPSRNAAAAFSPTTSRLSQESQEMTERGEPPQDQSASSTSLTPSTTRSIECMPPSLDVFSPSSMGSNATFKVEDPIVFEGAERLNMPWPEENIASNINAETKSAASNLSVITPDRGVPTSGRNNSGTNNHSYPSKPSRPEPLFDTTDTALPLGVEATTENPGSAPTPLRSLSTTTNDSSDDVGPFNEIRDPESIPAFEDNVDHKQKNPATSLSKEPHLEKKPPAPPGMPKSYSPPSSQQPSLTNIVQQERQPPPPPSPLPWPFDGTLLPAPPSITTLALNSSNAPSRQGPPPLTQYRGVESLSRPDSGPEVDTSRTNAATLVATTNAPSVSSRSSSIATTFSIGPFDEIRDQETIARFDVDVDFNHIDPDPQQVLEAKLSQRELKRRRKEIETSSQESEKGQDKKSGQQYLG